MAKMAKKAARYFVQYRSNLGLWRAVQGTEGPVMHDSREEAEHNRRVLQDLDERHAYRTRRER